MQIIGFPNIIDLFTCCKIFFYSYKIVLQKVRIGTRIYNLCYSHFHYVVHDFLFLNVTYIML